MDHDDVINWLSRLNIRVQVNLCIVFSWMSVGFTFVRFERVSYVNFSCDPVKFVRSECNLLLSEQSGLIGHELKPHVGTTLRAYFIVSETFPKFSTIGHVFVLAHLLHAKELTCRTDKMKRHPSLSPPRDTSDGLQELPYSSPGASPTSIWRIEPRRHLSSCPTADQTHATYIISIKAMLISMGGRPYGGRRQHAGWSSSGSTNTFTPLFLSVGRARLLSTRINPFFLLPGCQLYKSEEGRRRDVLDWEVDSPPSRGSTSCWVSCPTC